MNFRPFYVYEIKNTVNNKRYIGRTVHLKGRWRAHTSRIRNSTHPSAIGDAIKKHGVQNFKFSVLSICSTAQEYCRQEILYILKKNTLAPNGYNLTTGGRGGLPGYTFTPKQIRKLRLSLGGREYKPLTKEHKERIRKALLGKKRAPFTAEHRRNMSKGQMGKPSKNKGKILGPLSEGHKRKVARASKNSWKNISVRKKRVNGLIKSWRKKNRRSRQIEALKLNWRDPVYRKKVITGIKNAWVIKRKS